MALKASLVITGIAIGLLVLYGADVVASINMDGEIGEKSDGFLPLNDMQRGMGLGGMIIISGVLILIVGLAMVGTPAPEGVERNPVMLFAPGIFQIALGAIKIKKSSN